MLKVDSDRMNFLIENPTTEVDDDEIVEIYRGKCIICRKPSNTIHEINPKSLCLTWKKWINRVLLCSKCHLEAHNHGTIHSRDYLIRYRNLRLGEYWNIWLKQH